MGKQHSKVLPVGFLGTLLVTIVLVISLETQSLLAQTQSHYKDLAPDIFLKSWKILGPIPIPGSSDTSSTAPTEEAQRKAFDTDFLASCGSETGIYASPTPLCRVNGQDYRWTLKESAEEVVDLAREIGPKNYAVAYALAEVESSAALSVIVGMGSDDAVKLWLNGKLVHQNWIHRPLQNDQDLVLLQLRQGRNQLLMKIQNGLGDWGFACRALGPRNLEERLWTTAKKGNLELLQMILAYGGRIQLNSKPKYNLTPWQIATIFGRTDVTELLAAKGADTTLLIPKPEVLLDNILSGLTQGLTPGIAVLVAKNGHVLLSKGYGFASLEHRVPVTPETKFRIGSVTKQFTGSAILRLQEQGKLSVNDHLSKFIPDYPRGSEVTIRHLLNHTSGIHSFTSKPDFMRFVTVGVEKPEDWIQTFKSDPYDFDPGTAWAYNNSGYFLLGYIIEKVSGQTYAEYLKSQIFEPLGMKDTGVHTATAVLEHEAFGYSYEGSTVRKAINWDSSKGGAAGWLYSTVKDLSLWNEGLFGGKVLKEESLQAALTPVKTGAQPADENGYGYGFGIGKFRGLKVIAHAGGFDGFHSHLALYPTENVTIVLLSNEQPALPSRNLNELAGDAAQIFLAERMKSRSKR